MAFEGLDSCPARTWLASPALVPSRTQQFSNHGLMKHRMHLRLLCPDTGRIVDVWARMACPWKRVP
jgi:hypothetical protein